MINIPDTSEAGPNTNRFRVIFVYPLHCLANWIWVPLPETRYNQQYIYIYSTAKETHAI